MPSALDVELHPGRVRSVSDPVRNLVRVPRPGPGQDGVDAADGVLGHGLADVQAAARQLAVVARTRASDLEAGANYATSL